MRKIYLTLYFAVSLFASKKGLAQCASTATLGSSSNFFTLIRNSTNPIVADKNLNTVIYLHRNDMSLFGGDNGQYRYDISTNGGTTWTTNIGVLNPLNTGTASARYPNAAIYNPSANVTPTNAYIGYLGATTNTSTGLWNGQVSGVRQLNGGGNTENYNQPAGPGMLIPSSLVKGAPGVFWSVDAIYNGTLVTGFKIYKGTWTGSDISWVTNFSVTPSFNTSYNGNQFVGDYNIAFDPTGNIGYMSFLGHINGGPTNYAFYPIFYKTIDGGTTWTGPTQVDINQFSCITSNLTGGNYASTVFEHDLTVDINGNPHLITGVGNGLNYSFYFGLWHHMYDITCYNGVWNAFDIANVNAGRATYSVTPNQASMDLAPQISRTADGKKIFFFWGDNSTYALGAANTSPNLMSKSFDVQTFKWTSLKDFTSCNVGMNGQILFPHVATEALEPTLTTYKIPFVYGLFSVPGDPSFPVNFRFGDNALYSNSDYTVNQTMAGVSIQQGSNWLLCTGGSASLNISGVFNEVLWNTGSTTNSISVNTPSTYIVTGRNGCNIGADTITVAGMTVNLTPGNTTTLCTPNSATLSISGNALSYTWMPGNLTNTTIVVTPTANTVYTVSAAGNSCTYPQTVSVTIGAPPTLSVSGQNIICAGQSTTLTASGAATFTWTAGPSTFTLATTPTANTVYTVTGTAANTCTNLSTYGVTVNPLPTLSITTTNSVLCAGSTATLTASGANTYTWSNFTNAATVAVSPTVTTTYTVNGSGSNSCIGNSVYTQVVSPCTGLYELADGSNIKVYPNPFDTSIHIEFETESKNSVTIMDITGRIVFENKCNDLTMTINTASLEPGIYQIFISSDKTKSTYKIIKL